MDDARVRVLRQSCAPKSFPCPQCGTPGRRKDTHTRSIRDIAWSQIALIELTVGECRAACTCCKTFRSHVEGITPRAEYTNRVRDAVIDDGSVRCFATCRRRGCYETSCGRPTACSTRSKAPSIAVSSGRSGQRPPVPGRSGPGQGLLGPEKFDTMMTFLHSPAVKRVRTNNHVERTNRRLRHFEKVRYKWRRRRTIVRFIVLALERGQYQRITQEQHEDTRSRKPHALLLCKQAAC